MFRMQKSLGVSGLRFIIGTLWGVGGGGVGALNAHNKDLVRPIEGSIVPYPPPPYLPKGPYEFREFREFRAQGF